MLKTRSDASCRGRMRTVGRPDDGPSRRSARSEWVSPRRVSRIVRRRAPGGAFRSSPADLNGRRDLCARAAAVGGWRMVRVATSDRSNPIRASERERNAREEPRRAPHVLAVRDGRDELLELRRTASHTYFYGGCPVETCRPPLGAGVLKNGPRPQA